MSKRRPERSQLWFNDDSCVRWQPEWRDLVWSYDFVVNGAHDERPVTTLSIMDERPRSGGACCLTRAVTAGRVDLACSIAIARHT